MPVTMNCPEIEGDMDSVLVYNKSNYKNYVLRRKTKSTSPSTSSMENDNQSTLLRQDTFYVDSTFEDSNLETASTFEKYDSLEYEEFETEDLQPSKIKYRPRTLLEAVDFMLSILDDLGEKYNKWKYNNFGFYRFYCHKYNLANFSDSRPYYTKILSQLDTLDTLSQLSSPDFKTNTDASIYSPDFIVDKVLCQLDELVSCFCSKNCAFGMSQGYSHTCSDNHVNHSSLKWKYPQGSETYLGIKGAPKEKSILTDKSKNTDKTSPLDWSRPFNRIYHMDKNLFQTTFTSETIPELMTLIEKPNQENNLDKSNIQSIQTPQDMLETCFIRDMGAYDNCVMEFFSERGIMHNFSYPYCRGEETSYTHPFIRAAVCYNCGKICRCKCQRKIFRTFSRFYTQTDEKNYPLESISIEYVNQIYGYLKAKSRISDTLESDTENKSKRERKHNNMTSLELNTIYSHSINTEVGRVQFLVSPIENQLTPRRYRPNVPSQAGEEAKESIPYDEDRYMGSVYYSNLFKASECNVSLEEIFKVINNVPFPCVSEEHLEFYKKVEWYDLYRSPWWCMDSKYEQTKIYEEEGYLNSYIMNTLDSLGYLTNVRYDTSLKVIGVGHYSSDNDSYWRYFYTNDNIWKVFREAIEYLILISTLPEYIYLDHGQSCWILITKSAQKMFSIYPSLIKSYHDLVTYYKSNSPKRDHRGKQKNTADRDCERQMNHLERKEDYGEENFDIKRVSAHECTVADVLRVSLKRKMVSSGESFTPRRYYVEKSSTLTPSIRLKLDHELIYQGIFASTPNSSYYSAFSNSVDLYRNNGPPLFSPTPGKFSSIFNAYAGGKDLGLDSGEIGAGKRIKGGKVIDLKLNNLNVLLSQYPDARSQYTRIIKHANELRFQSSILISDLSSPAFRSSGNPNPHVSHSDFNSYCYETPRHLNSNYVSISKIMDERVQDLPMFDVFYNDYSNSWICMLDVVPCLVCPVECQNNGSCLHFTHGKRLIEFICKKMKPSDVKYTYPQTNGRGPSSYQPKKSQIVLISFSVEEFGNERAKLLATQLKATYKMQALNSMLINVKQNHNSSKDHAFRRNDRPSTCIEMKLLHNAITAQLSSMISTNSFISSSETNYLNGIDDELDETCYKMNQLCTSPMSEDDSQKVNDSSEDNSQKVSDSSQDEDTSCVCYKYGRFLTGMRGVFPVSEILNYDKNMHVFCKLLEVEKVMNIVSENIHFCSTHACFMTTWIDIMGQRRIMYHPIYKYINIRSFNNYSKRFDADWPEAIESHNAYTLCYDAVEASKKFSQANDAIADAFYLLLNLQEIINEALISGLALAVRTISDASQEKALLRRLHLIYRRFKLSSQTVRNSLIFSKELLFPFGALYDEATPPVSDDDV
ncbi:hypothetical protein TpMuguga_04g00692 [Theileria parva strain Muguga]|uniref:Uncharacterized protein n=1 Tax=Theileria parva TaxID=5875 RepID=Q4N1P0_THEPA|nr:uncharacterized protein TpMuguga_04g00692 [Theileria parva strain Muguga]EAN32045.1 hypothetical protein TpMuguga_04g00692 [Theileria parva strain Muguga]|eukprot:XP_764328.1 hypothetical protein [Theileria parva strain Muguga]